MGLSSREHVHAATRVPACPRVSPRVPVCPACPQRACVSNFLSIVQCPLWALCDLLPWATFPQIPSCHTRVTTCLPGTRQVSGLQTQPPLGKLSLQWGGHTAASILQ